MNSSVIVKRRVIFVSIDPIPEFPPGPHPSHSGNNDLFVVSREKPLGKNSTFSDYLMAASDLWRVFCKEMYENGCDQVIVCFKEDEELEAMVGLVNQHDERIKISYLLYGSRLWEKQKKVRDIERDRKELQQIIGGSKIIIADLCRRFLETGKIQ